ncbi:MAG TPA: hypothetical protein VM680_11045 [Verrucomicrobiae bacterium]|nr:hypothetical protein [Verrucomicrobiae bacterium]
MGLQGWAFALEIVGTCCWIACFIWMYRISARQEELLNSLHEQARKITELSKAEHELIKEVHPQVGEIHKNVQDVMDAVTSESERKN